jgi:hypothetical protein
MPTPRDLNRVIPQMLEVLPEEPRADDVDKVTVLRKILTNVAKRIQYTPPEMQQDAYTTLQAAIKNAVTTVPSKLEEDSWDTRIVEIWTKKSLAQLIQTEEHLKEEQRKKDEDKERGKN